MNIKESQMLFSASSNKEHWKKLKMLLYSKDKENIVMGITLLEDLDEKIYYDGICTFFSLDNHRNWIFREDVECLNPDVLKLEIIHLAQKKNIQHDLTTAFEQGLLDTMFWKIFEDVPYSKFDTYIQENLISKSRQMIPIQSKEKQRLFMKYPVNQGFWEEVMKTQKNPSHFKGASRPVEGVDWFDCVHFANRLSEKEGLEKAYRIQGKEVTMDIDTNGYRLPTDEEWQFAATGQEQYTYSGGNDIGDVAWYDRNSQGKTHSVGLKQPNGNGLYDMSGNVWEWCWNITRSKPLYRMFRGGSWNSFDRDCSISNHSQYAPSFQSSSIGFRLCRNVLT